jgi:cytoskeletal protein RodZ
LPVVNNQKRNKKKRRLKKLLIFVIILFVLLIFAGILLIRQRENEDRQQRKAEAIAALESVPTVTPTPAATPTPIPTVTPTPVLERAYVFDPDDYLGSWHSKNGRVVIEITKLSQKSVTFTYSQTNKKKTATCEATVKKSVAGNASRFSFTDSLGNVAKGYFTFDNGILYVKIKTKTKAEGAKVHPSVDGVMIRG